MRPQIDLESSLFKHFQYRTFRDGQKEIIQDVMRGNDVLGVLPTGSGKSICYQLPSILMSGSTIVISPLISLMMDQIKQLKAMNFKKVVSLNSFNDYRERMKILNQLHTYKLVYISPELLQQETIISHLSRIKVSLVVIDEAHCISQWGHEFRPDYLKLYQVIKQLNDPPILALSATVTSSIQKDIIQSLRRPKMVTHIYPMDRENIALTISQVTSEWEKMNEINKLLKKYRVPTLIYFSSRDKAENISNLLSKEHPNHRISYYHGGMEQIDRVTIQQQFMNNQLDVVCCTSAFGMGINKDNIRIIIHYHFPPQLESYIQEIGRAGRDGKESLSVLLYSKSDVFLPKSLIESELPTETELKHVFIKLHELYRNNMHLPSNESEIYKQFQINESQWRFIHSQLEKNDMIVDNQIIYNKESWRKGFSLINTYRFDRWQIKQDKLADMTHWIEENDCLRKHLYKNYQSSYKQPKYQCCSNCHFDLNKFNPEQTINSTELNDVWEDKLRKLLLIEVSNEAK